MAQFNIKQLVQRDLPYIIVIILCLGAVIYDLQHQSAILDSCNAHWQKQIQLMQEQPGLYPGLKAPDNPVPFNYTWRE